jgi:hypothetical protein
MSGSNHRNAFSSPIFCEPMEARRLLSASTSLALNPAADDSGSDTVFPLDNTSSTDTGDGSVVVDHFGGVLQGGSIDDGNGGVIMYSFNAGSAHSHHANHAAHVHHASHVKTVKHHAK